MIVTVFAPSADAATRSTPVSAMLTHTVRSVAGAGEADTRNCTGIVPTATSSGSSSAPPLSTVRLSPRTMATDTSGVGATGVAVMAPDIAPSTVEPPVPLTARIWKLYCVPSVSPVTVWEVREALLGMSVHALQTKGSPDPRRTWYLVMVPLGAVQLRSTSPLASPAVAVRPVGASRAPASSGVAVTTAEAGLIPIVLEA